MVADCFAAQARDAARGRENRPDGEAGFGIGRHEVRDHSRPLENDVLADERMLMGGLAPCVMVSMERVFQIRGVMSAGRMMVRGGEMRRHRHNSGPGQEEGEQSHGRHHLANASHSLDPN